MNELPAKKTAAKDLLWLQLLEAQTIKKMKKCGPGRQTVFAAHHQCAGAPGSAGR
jgi:hypothetical protein